jgi:hypothetical protein
MRKNPKVREPKGSKSPAPEKRIERARFKYVFDDSYNPVYANGAYGGPTPHGEIAVNFFVERNPVPLSETLAVSPDGRPAAPISREPELPDGTVEVIRFITTGVIMSRETARRVYDFLGRHLQAIDAVAEARKGLERIGSASKLEASRPSPRKRNKPSE